jgi:hypothetical protein
VQVTLKNFGPTPALNIKFYQYVAVSDLDIPPDEQHRWVTSRQSWRPRRTITLPPSQVATYNGPLAQEQLEQIDRSVVEQRGGELLHRLTVYSRIVVYYSDVFARRYRFEYMIGSEPRQFQGGAAGIYSQTGERCRRMRPRPANNDTRHHQEG